MRIFKKIKDFIFKPHISDENVSSSSSTRNGTFRIELGTLKENSDKTSFITNNRELLEPGDLYYMHNKIYLYNNDRLEELIYREYKFESLVEFHYYDKEDLTKSFLRNLLPGQLFGLMNPSYGIYICILDNDKNKRYVLVEGDGELEIFIEDCKEE